MSNKSKKETKKLKLKNRMLRYRGDNLKSLDLENPNLKNALDNVVNVSADGIEVKQEKLKEVESSIASLLISNEAIFKPFIGQYCNKTGKFIYNLSQDNFSSLLKLHGRERSLSLLIDMHTENYAIEWLDTSPKVLNKQMLQDQAGYFVYAASLFFVLKEPANVFATETLFGAEKVTAIEPFRLKKIAFLQDKIQTRKHLLAMQQTNKKLIIEANELLRRLLGLASPTLAALSAFFKANNLLETCITEANLKTFISNLKENLTFIIRRHFQSIRSKIHADRKKLYTVTSKEIEAIKKELLGLSQFHNQPAIKNQSKRTSIMLDMREFFVDGEIESGEEQEDVLEGFSELDFLSTDDEAKKAEAKKAEAFHKPKNCKTQAIIVNKPQAIPTSSGFKLKLSKKG